MTYAKVINWSFFKLPIACVLLAIARSSSEIQQDTNVPEYIGGGVGGLLALIAVVIAVLVLLKRCRNR